MSLDFIQNEVIIITLMIAFIVLSRWMAKGFLRHHQLTPKWSVLIVAWYMETVRLVSGVSWMLGWFAVCVFIGDYFSGEERPTILIYAWQVMWLLVIDQMSLLACEMVDHHNSK
jgi:hypothetical protein